MGTWTGSDWTLNFTLAQDNLICGLLPASSSTGFNNSEGGKNKALLTDGLASPLGKELTQCLGNNAVLTYEFGKEVSISEVRIYATWADDGRDKPSIASVYVNKGTESEAQIGGAFSYDISTANCATLSAGGFMAAGVSSITITFASQENGYVGYSEIEVIGISGGASGIYGVRCDTPVGLEPWSGTLNVEMMTPLSEEAEIEWKMNDEIAGVGETLPLSNLSAGMYMIEVKVTDRGSTWYATNEVAVYANDVYLDASCQSPQFPFWKKECAATNTARAIEAFIYGSRLHIYPGTYDLPFQLAIYTGKEVIGEGKPEEIILKRGEGNTRLVLVSGPGALLKNLTIDGLLRGDGVVKVAEGARCENCIIVGGCTIRNTNGGGCLQIYDTSSVVSNCVIGNTTQSKLTYPSPIYYGLGVRQYGGLITHCVITNVQDIGMHRSAAHASGVGVYQSGGTLRNSLIAHNVCKDGEEGTDRRFAAGVYQTGGTIENCTITANSSESGPAGYYRYNGGTMVNSIVWGNTNSDKEGIYGDHDIAGTTTEGMTFCTIENPVFKNASKGDFRLKNSSPALNAGTNLDWMTDATDLGGVPRILQRRVDLGCYEYKNSGMSLFVW